MSTLPRSHPATLSRESHIRRAETVDCRKSALTGTMTARQDTMTPPSAVAASQTIASYDVTSACNADRASTVDAATPKDTANSDKVSASAITSDMICVALAPRNDNSANS